MWPSLMASTITRSSGSQNFELSSSKQVSPSAERHFVHQNTYKLFISSWNVGGITPPEQLNTDNWFDSQKHTADIYVFGFQEIVPLNAGNILGAENSRISLQWNSLIGAALNKTVPPLEKIEEAEVEEYQRTPPVKEHNPADASRSQGFQCIISKQMVGIFRSVWVRTNLCSYVRHPSVSCVSCGIMGLLGNKGSVSIRFFLHETSFCFVCSHLASGGKQGDEKHRNADATEILSRTRFPQGRSHGLPRKILDHDRVIWLGDLNYRIHLAEATTRSLVKKKQWSILLQNDQLRSEFMEGHVFEGWQEGVIEFAPTYKKGKRTHTPAWCDRIIWFRRGLKQHEYSRGESRLSDHKPVRAIFTAQVDVLEPMGRSNEKSFL
ncbi:Inositol-polyphosphate 5-phosphatase [Bertholletia excelsa]